MKFMLRNVLGLSLLFATTMAFACDYPAKIDIPNGMTATKEEMLTGQRSVKQFVADMEAYLDCIVSEEKNARSELDSLEPEEEQLREDMLNKKYNAAVEDMETIAAAFNNEVQAYRSRDN